VYSWQGLFVMTLTDVATTWAEVIIRVKVTSAQVVKTSVSVITNSPSQNCTHRNGHTSKNLWYDSWIQTICKVRIMLKTKWEQETTLHEIKVKSVGFWKKGVKSYLIMFAYKASYSCWHACLSSQSLNNKQYGCIHVETIRVDSVICVIF